MQGEVTVPYTSIGGQNMDSGIMPADIGGSSGDFSGNQSGTMTISWKLPGGITGFKYDGTGQWGYFLGPKAAGNVTATDENIKEWLTERVYTQEQIEFGDPAVVLAINTQMANYASRIIRLGVGGEGDQAELDEFRSKFAGCWIVH